MSLPVSDAGPWFCLGDKTWWVDMVPVPSPPLCVRLVLGCCVPPCPLYPGASVFTVTFWPAVCAPCWGRPRPSGEDPPGPVAGSTGVLELPCHHVISPCQPTTFCRLDKTRDQLRLQVSLLAPYNFGISVNSYKSTQCYQETFRVITLH